MSDDAKYPEILTAALRAFLKRGMVVQLHPEHTQSRCFSGCFFTVTEVRAWGAQGYVQPIGETLSEPPAGQCHYRALWTEMCVVTPQTYSAMNAPAAPPQWHAEKVLAFVGWAPYGISEDDEEDEEGDD